MKKLLNQPQLQPVFMQKVFPFFTQVVVSYTLKKKKKIVASNQHLMPYFKQILL